MRPNEIGFNSINKFKIFLILKIILIFASRFLGIKASK